MGGYRLFDIDRKVIVEERNVTFYKTQKGSYHLAGNTKDNSCKDWKVWIEDFINLSSSKNEEIDSDQDDNNVENGIEQVDNQEINSYRSGSVKEIGKKVRPKGLTIAESHRRKEESLRERENRLREEGVRRSSS